MKDVFSTLPHCYHRAHWRATLAKHIEWVSIEDASALAQSRGILTVSAWKKFASSPAGRKTPVPANPQLVYADQWLGWEVFFGAEYRVTKVMPAMQRSFRQAREFARSLGLKSPREWLDFANSLECPPDLPILVHRSYENAGWKGYPDFLGYVPETGSEKPFWSFTKARQYAHSLGLSGSPGFRAWAVSEARPPEMPMHPERTYEKSWRGWEDFLGESYASTAKGPERTVMPFELARYAAHSLGLRAGREYAQWVRSRRRAAGMPVRPDTAYRKDGWKGWPDFLGYGKGA